MNQTSDVSQSQENISKSIETREQTVITPNPQDLPLESIEGMGVCVQRGHGTGDLMDVELGGVDAFKYHIDFMRFRVCAQDEIRQHMVLVSVTVNTSLHP